MARVGNVSPGKRNLLTCQESDLGVISFSIHANSYISVRSLSGVFFAVFIITNAHKQFLFFGFAKIFFIFNCF